VIEAVSPEGNQPFLHRFMELNKLVMTGGCERAIGSRTPGRGLREQDSVWIVSLARRWSSLWWKAYICQERARSNPFKQIADTTGGRAFFPTSVKDLDGVYEKVVAEIRAQYAIGYVSTNEKTDGAWRKVEVEVARKEGDLRRRARGDTSRRSRLIGPTASDSLANRIDLFRVETRV